MKTPRQLGYRWPAEWEPHAATWLSWPHNRNTWPGAFEAAVEEYSRFVHVLSEAEPVHVLADGMAFERAEKKIGHLSKVTLHRVPTDDAWIRDHGPTILCTDRPSEPRLAALNWRFNSWGNKYPPFVQDDQVPVRIAELLNIPRFDIDIVLEGGAIDGNGKGIVLTTESCVLDSRRNSNLSREIIEQLFSDYLGTDSIIWLAGEIPGDDTDGHVDQLARFVTHNTIVTATSNELPGLASNRHRILQAHPELEVIELPLPSPKFHGDQRLPTSYANFYIANDVVIVPSFSDVQDDRAAGTLRECFPNRTVISLPAINLSVGLGSFHCLTQQQPR